MRSAQRGSLAMGSMLRPAALRILGAELAGTQEIVENSLSERAYAPSRSIRTVCKSVPSARTKALLKRGSVAKRA